MIKKPAPKPARPVFRGPGQVRIIAGRWRGSKLPVGAASGLRPTSDRVRETLFNWLMPALPGARVLDLFAGSGALGLEAVSRGAASAVLVERDPGLAASLQATTERLSGGEIAKVIRADALVWLPAQPRASFDIAFVDPPFASGQWEPVLAGLLPLLANDAWLYVEAPLAEPIVLPHGWILHREGRTREVRYAVYRPPASRLTSGTAVAVDTLPETPENPGSNLLEPAIK